MRCRKSHRVWEPSVTRPSNIQMPNLALCLRQVVYDPQCLIFSVLFLYLNLCDSVYLCCYFGDNYWVYDSFKLPPIWVSNCNVSVTMLCDLIRKINARIKRRYFEMFLSRNEGAYRHMRLNYKVKIVKNKIYSARSYIR